MRQNLIKLLATAGILGFVAIVFSNSVEVRSTAENDPILTEIAEYKNWTRVSKEPIKVDASLLSIGA